MIDNNFNIDKLADFGSSEPWVARIWMSFNEFIDKLYTKNYEKNNIKIAFNDLYETLSLAFMSLRDIQKINKEPNITLLNSKKKYFDFYNNLWIAYKDRFHKAMKELGYNIGFLFHNDQRFKIGIKEFFEKHTSLPKDFIQVIIESRKNWQNKLSEIRNNYIQHKYPSNEIEKEFFNLYHAEFYFYNVWTLIEYLTINLMALKMPNILCFQEIEESKRDVKCPRRYKITINPLFTGSAGSPERNSD